MALCSALCDPRGRWYRYFILFLLCYMSVTQFFCIEMPSGLQGTIIKVFKLNSKQYNLLFSSYTWSDIVMSVLGGVLIDRVIGLRAGYLIVTIIAILGQGVLTLGAFLDNFIVIVTGRFIMGCGIGTLKCIGNVCLQARWFDDKEITFAMSFTFCSCRLAASLGLLLPQLIYESSGQFLDGLGLPGNHNQVGIAFLVGFLLLLSSLFICIVIVLLDIKGASKLDREPFKRRSFTVKDLQDFSPRFWMSITGLAIFYTVLYVFVANGQLFFISKFGFSIIAANIANCLVFVAPVIITPAIGYLVQIIGYNALWGIVGALVGMGTHLLFNVAVQDQFLAPFFISSLFSLAYSFFGTSVYAIPSFIIQKHQLTTAYSLYNILHSILFISTSVIAGIIIDYHGYMLLETYFLFLLFFVVILLGIVTVLDTTISDKDRKVNRPGSVLIELSLKRWKSRKEARENANNKQNDYFSNGFLLAYHYDDN